MRVALHSQVCSTLSTKSGLSALTIRLLSLSTVMVSIHMAGSKIITAVFGLSSQSTKAFQFHFNSRKSTVVNLGLSTFFKD